MVIQRVTITSIKFRNFKALDDYSIKFQRINILVGQNNSGKSTIVGALRALDVALRSARNRPVSSISHEFADYEYGLEIPVTNMSISLENVHTNYNDKLTTISFRLTNGNELFLLFPSQRRCVLTWRAKTGAIYNPAAFKTQFPLKIQCIPVLGPIEFQEPILTKDTIRSALATHRASRHFRNFWWHFRDGFEEFRDLVSGTWPDVELELPERDQGSGQTLVMFCKERRIPRELFWSGFGFQVWCQLLTHVSRTSDASILVADEPDLYLHADMQRQLVGILREAGPDIVVATHSSEIIGEADPTEILVINKNHSSARRLGDIEGVQDALETIGSVHNLTLTNLARTKRILFVEGMDDYKRIRRFAARLGYTDLAAGLGLTALEAGGFSSWEMVLSLAWGVNRTLGADLKIAAIYDRDYRPDEEVEEIEVRLRARLQCAHLHKRKEMENYLLVPSVVARAVKQAVAERAKRQNHIPPDIQDFNAVLDQISLPLRVDAQSQYMAKYNEYFRKSGLDQATLNKKAIGIFNSLWDNLETRMTVIPGKEMLKQVRNRMQVEHSISLTDIRLIDSFQAVEIPEDMKLMLASLEAFRKS